ncbi:MAG: hypothetical protein R3293_21495, partial [Candidatus Promineifilaceae bacterium]|nr:hypothetical protein [Candidatus Promineifilaceae bacterium]
YDDEENPLTYEGFVVNEQDDLDLRNFAIRTDVVEDEDFQIVVPVSAADKDIVAAMAAVIAALEGVEEVKPLTVNFHIPANPYYAQGYIAEQEENSPKGRVSPQGHNPWG